MRVEYNEEEKQLRIIAANLEEQDELAGLAECLRHAVRDAECLCYGDTVKFEYELSDDRSDRCTISLGGDLERKRGDKLEFTISDPDWPSLRAVRRFIYRDQKRECGPCELFYLWVEEIPVDGWNVLVLAH